MGKLIVHRRGYRRRDGTYVKATTFPIRDRGHPGRTPVSKQWFPREDEAHHLAYDGVEWHADLTDEERHRILTHLAKTKGWTPLIKRLNALRNVSTSRKLDRAAAEDIKWMRRQK
jgi:hypothetical protein